MTNPTNYSECKELFAALSEYLDAALPPADCASIEAHIAQCPPCIEFVNSLKKSVQLCRESGTFVEPPPLSNDLRQQLLAAYRASVPASAS